jgi:hypothetical protein
MAPYRPPLPSGKGTSRSPRPTGSGSRSGPPDSTGGGTKSGPPDSTGAGSRSGPPDSTGGGSRSGPPDSTGAGSRSGPPDSTGSGSGRVIGGASLKPRSLIRQSFDSILDIPQGVIELGKGAAYAPVGGARAVVDLATNQRLSPGENNTGSAWSQVSGNVRHYNPLIADISTSVKDTTRRVAPLVLGPQNGWVAQKQAEAIKEYKEASDEGRIVDLGLEDVGNVSLLAAGAGAVAGRVVGAGGVGVRAATTARAAAATRTTLGKTLGGSSQGAALRSLGAGARTGAKAPVRIKPGSLSQPGKLTRSNPSTLRVPGTSRPGTIRVAGFGEGIATTAQRGKGLAGYLERKGATSVANDVAGFGDAARRVSLGAELLDPTTHVFRLPGKAVRGVTKGAATIAPDTAIGKRAQSRLDRPSNRIGAEARESVTEARNEAQKAAIEVRKISKSMGLKDAESAAAMDLADERFAGTAETGRRLLEEQGPEAVEVFLTKENSLISGAESRLDIEQIVAYTDYKRSVAANEPVGTMTGPLMEKIGLVRERVVKQAEERRDTRVQQAAVEGKSDSMDSQLAQPRIELVDAKGDVVETRNMPRGWSKLSRTDPAAFRSKVNRLGFDEGLDARVISPEMQRWKVDQLREPIQAKIDDLNKQIELQQARMARRVREADVREGFAQINPEPGASVDPTTRLGFYNSELSKLDRQFKAGAKKLDALQRNLDSLLDDRRASDPGKFDARVDKGIAEGLKDIAEETANIELLVKEQQDFLADRAFDFSDEAQTRFAEKPEMTGMLDADELRSIGDDIHKNLIREASARIEDLTDGSRPQVPTLEGSQTGIDQGDSVDGPQSQTGEGVTDTRVDANRNGWWNDGNDSVVMKGNTGRYNNLREYVVRGWIAEAGQGNDFGRWADDIMSRHPGQFDSREAVMNRYLDLVDESRKIDLVKDGYKSSQVVEAIVNSTLLPEKEVRAALSNKADFKKIKEEQARDSIAEIDEAIKTGRGAGSYEGAASAKINRDMFAVEWETLKGEGGDTQAFLTEYLGSDATGMSLTEAGNMVHSFEWDKLEAWIDETLYLGRAADSAEVVAAKVAAKALEFDQAIVGARAMRDDLQTDINELVDAKTSRDAVSAEQLGNRTTTQRLEAERKRSDGSTSQDPWKRQGALSELVLDETIDPNTGATQKLTAAQIEAGQAGRPFRRTVKSALSIAEREQAAMVRARTYAQVEQRNMAKLESQRARWQHKNDALELSLERSVQERMREQSNRTVKNIQNATSRLVSNEHMGQVETAGSGQAPSVSGVMGEIARKGGFQDLLVESLIDLDRRADGDRGSGYVEAKADAFMDAAMQSGVVVSPGDWDRFSRVSLADDLTSLAEQYTQRNLGGSNHMAISNLSNVLLDRIREYDEANASRFTNPRQTVRKRGGKVVTEAAVTEMGKRLPEDLRLAIDAEYQAHARARFRLMEQTTDKHMAVMPARFRAIALNSRRAVRSLNEMAEEAIKAGDRHSASAYYNMMDDIPTSMQAMVDKGIVDPVHLIGGGEVSLNQSGPSGAAGGPRPLRDRGSSELKSGARVTSLAEYVKIEAKEMSALITKQAMEMIGSSDSTYSHLITDSDMGGLLSKYEERVAKNGNRSLTNTDYIGFLKNEGYSILPEDFRTNTKGLPDTELGRAADEFEINEMRGAPEGGLADDGPALKPGDPTYWSKRIIPTSVLSELNALSAVTGDWLRRYDQTVQGWKVFTLAWSPSWLVNNAIGNAFMATVGAGLSPVSVAMQVNRVRQQMKADTGKGMIRSAWSGNDALPPSAPDHLSRSGLTYGDQRMLTDAASHDGILAGVLGQLADSSKSRIGVPGKAQLRPDGSAGLNFGRASEFSYSINEMTDNLFRTAVYDLKLKEKLPIVPAELLDSTGQFKAELTVSPDTIRQILEDPYATPAQKRFANEAASVQTSPAMAEFKRIEQVVAKADTDSVQASLNAMGDFSDMSPNERKYIRRTFPFYAWLKHQTQAAIRLPLSSPQRAAWLSTLAETLNPEYGEMGDGEEKWFGQSITIPDGLPGAGRTIGLGQGNPYSSVKDLVLNPTNLSNTFGAMSPVIKEPIKAVTGFDLQQRELVSRPNDQKELGALGTPPSSLSRILGGDMGGFGELGYNVAGTLRQARGIRDMLNGTGQARYGSGDLRADKNGRALYPRKNITLVEQLAKTVGMPFIPTDTKQLRDYLIEEDLLEQQRQQQGR